MFVSCKLYKVTPSGASKAEKLFKERGSRIWGEVYGNKMNFIVRPVESISKRGVALLSEVYYDRIVMVRTLDPETLESKAEPRKQTEGPISVALYLQAPLEWVLGVFANFTSAGRVTDIINTLLGDDSQGMVPDSIHKVRFLLDQKEEEIRKGIPEFSNVSEISVEEVNDDYIDAVWLKGSNLDASSEYRKYVTDDMSGGRLRFLTLAYKEKNYYLIEDGRIFTRQGTDPHDDYVIIHELVSKLNSKNAVRF